MDAVRHNPFSEETSRFEDTEAVRVHKLASERLRSSELPESPLRAPLALRARHVDDRRTLAHKEVYDDKLPLGVRIHVAMHTRRWNKEEISRLHLDNLLSSRAVLEPESTRDEIAVQPPASVMVPSRYHSAANPRLGDNGILVVEGALPNDPRRRTSGRQITFVNDFDLLHGRRDSAGSIKLSQTRAGHS